MNNLEFYVNKVSLETIKNSNFHVRCKIFKWLSPYYYLYFISIYIYIIYLNVRLFYLPLRLQLSGHSTVANLFILSSLVLYSFLNQSGKLISGRLFNVLEDKFKRNCHL